ncbi:MAG: ATP-dependent zinc metalloprotease FtsH [Anaerohalosphaeraceae bacterium]|nr:ATP-dependent zinc metalloprotease FtsH [Anaerohalosphaeraceae bacterium]
MTIDNKQSGKQTQKPSSKQPPALYKKKRFSWLLMGFIFLTFMLLADRYSNRDSITNDEFEKYLSEKKIEWLTIKETEISGEFNKAGLSSRPPKATKTFSVNYRAEMIEDIKKKIEASGTKWTVAPPQVWLSILSMLLPLILIVAFFYLIFARNMKNGPGGMLMGFGKSKHKLQGQGQNKVTFEDVAGIDEAKEEVAEIIEFLKHPKKFHKIGGRIPRGVLLIGPPGCGKTLLAKAIAGQADVPFFSISGSDFVEMFVGVGASRVRDLFTQAKTNSPCIIFLDEIDAIGRKRGPGFAGGGHDEREQTLNAILVEMDGFDTNDQVIVMAATNRGDILDGALTRPGRFDRQVFVSLPDIKGRAAILKIHSNKVKIGPDVELEKLARGTPMFSGADLEAIINEAAIAATMGNKDCVEMADLEEARDKVRWGRSKRSKTIDKVDKKLTAYHEAGHALVQALLEDADPLHKVSIIPRGSMGGATFSLPEKDRDYMTKKYCLAEMQVAFGGRVAEELFCDDISSGASSDIKMATSLAREMVKNWGMSDVLGPVDYSGQSQEMMFGATGKDYSEKVSETIDNEIKKLIDATHNKCKELIEANRDKLIAIAETLLKYETLDAAEVKILLDGGVINKPTVSDLLKAEQEKTQAESEIKEKSDNADNANNNEQSDDTA